MEKDASSLLEEKRRLTVDQVKTLERIFKEDNKLMPERKVRIAEEIGLQPRQVAVWFQNRRARWKTKQLERDYCVLKAHYDSLKLDYNNLQNETRVLTSKLKELRAKISEESREEKQSMSLKEPKRDREEGNKKIIQMVPTYHSNYPEKDINMVKLEDLFNVNSVDYAPNIPS